MILKSSMTQELLDHFISKIDSKHQTIGIKDRGLAPRLGQLYNDIYCDANHGSYTFGMYKGLINYSHRTTKKEYEYFINGQNSLIGFNQHVIHSVFVDTLCCIRRITEKDDDTKSITRLQTKIEREIKNRIPKDIEVKKWFKSLQSQYDTIISEMEPLRSYIDKRICHYDRTWESKRKLQKIEEIENVYNLINGYKNTFTGFYEPNRGQTTMISEGESNAALFIGVYNGNQHLNNLREIILDLAKNPEIPEDVRFTLLGF